MGGGSGSSASEAASLVFRIATVGLSLASAIMTATSTQCVYRDGGEATSTQCVYRDNGVPAGTVSYADYASFKYSAVADLLSAVLQGVAIYLEATRKDRAAKAVELIDKLVQALTSTSAALLFAVDDITSCGGPPRGGGGRQRQSGDRGGLCSQAAGAFCGRVRVSSTLPVAATVSVSASVYTRHAPVPAILASRRRPPPSVMNVTTVINVVERGDEGTRRKKQAEEKKCKVVELIVPEKKTTEEVKMEESPKEKEKKDQDQACTPPPATMPPPWCRCPRLTIPCNCEDPELCGAFF